MKVHAIHEIERNSVRIYIEVGIDADGRHLYLKPDGHPVGIFPGAEPPLYMRLDQMIAEAIAEALSPPPVASARHLDDAIEVRDRVMTLVEKLVQ